MSSHLEFLRQTESYRRELVRRLNEEDAYGVAKNNAGALQRTTTKEFYLSFDSFEYAPLDMSELLRRQEVDLLALLVWALGATAAMAVSARTMSGGVSA